MTARLVSSDRLIADALARIEAGSAGMWAVAQHAADVKAAIEEGATLLVTEGEAGVIQCNWEPDDQRWYVIHAFGRDETQIPMQRRLKAHLRTLPKERRWVRVKEAKHVYGERGERLDELLFKQALRARLVHAREYVGTDGKSHDTWWDINADDDNLERDLSTIPGGRT